MATTAGALSQVSVTDRVAKLLSAEATGGTAPYTYQWYRSTITGFSPGGGNIITGATSLSLTDTGLTPGVDYFYKVVATDAGSVSGTSSQLAVTTLAPQQSPNQFQQSPALGQVDQKMEPNTVVCQFDPSGSGTLVPGQAVKVSQTAGKVPQVVACTATSDQCVGFVNYNIKNQAFVPGDYLEVSMDGNVLFLVATEAISRFAKVTSLPDSVAGGCVGGVKAATGSSGLVLVGYAFDKAASGELFRVVVKAPYFGLDS